MTLWQYTHAVICIYFELCGALPPIPVTYTKCPCLFSTDKNRGKHKLLKYLIGCRSWKDLKPINKRSLNLKLKGFYHIKSKRFNLFLVLEHAKQAPPEMREMLNDGIEIGMYSTWKESKALQDYSLIKTRLFISHVPSGIHYIEKKLQTKEKEALPWKSSTV